MHDLQTNEVRILGAHLDLMMQELVQIKRLVIGLGYRDEQRAENAWDELMAASKQISKEWKGTSATEEIRSQRDKQW
ncbi:MAG: hypothetical protein FFODKBPE_00082 [Candidatus Argoarchaeum ethanivorans]|uniref:Uncharacterized protein n=1 Tax=Candidatus Argoarchaeum ethanivorans TaxID=2608793 RepID=A0A811T8K6_9EURY|nr:MAG: hypothetical protein FFODKBPE_00082 [Candidatus Argoarchaeum ethanivorans]